MDVRDDMTMIPQPAEPTAEKLLEIADALLPGRSLDDARITAGNLHHVVLLPGTAAVRVSKRPSSAQEMPRRMEVLREIARAGLPFDVPEPLTSVTWFGERTAVAVSWVDGEVGHLVGVLDGRPLTNVEGYVRSIVAWLEKDA
jgi:hypothetical protein